MKKYLVIGNPIEHSLSPLLHNFWLKKYGINAIYEKQLVEKNDIEKIISDMRASKIEGINVTVPFKKAVIPFLDQLSDTAKETESVNTIFKKQNKLVGDNTDVYGFSEAIKLTNFNLTNKKVLILGAGGVVPSIVLALKSMETSEITLSNRTKKKADDLKKNFPFFFKIAKIFFKNSSFTIRLFLCFFFGQGSGNKIYITSKRSFLNLLINF